MEFSETLARLRRQVGMTTPVLARAMGLDPVAIDRIERGENRVVDRQMVLDLARALNLNDAQTDELLWSANHLPHRIQFGEVAREARETKKVALFVDHENVYIALNELLRTLAPDLQAQDRRKVEPSTLAIQLRAAAEQIGFVKVALAVADWERLPSGQVKEYLKHLYQIDYNLPGRNNADLKLSDAIRNVLEHGENDDIDDYVLVTGDGGYLTILETLLRRQKRVHVWGVRGATSALLQQNATSFLWIDELLGMASVRLDLNGDEARLHDGAAQISIDGIGDLGGLPVGNDVSRLEAIAIHLAKHLRQRSWTFITFVRFLAFLDETRVFGETREEQLAWLSHAKETDILREEIVDDPSDSSRIARRFYLNESHSLVKRASAIRARVGEIVPLTGRGLAFGVVVDRLVNDLQLQITDVQAKNWLSWFGEAGYLQAEQVPHFRKEGVTVTLLRQVPGAFESSGVNDDDADQIRLIRGAEFTALRLADFLERHPHFAWMALSQLLNRMSGGPGATMAGVPAVNRQLAKQAIAQAEEIGLVEIEQVPNVKTGGTTTVAHLNRNAPRIGELIALRDAMIRRLAEMLVSRSSISRAAFQASAAELLDLGYDDAGAWIDFLIAEGIFLLDQDHDGVGGNLRTDQQDLIVSRVLFRVVPPVVRNPERV